MEQVPLAVTPVAEVHFATGSFVLDAASRATLDGLVASLDHTETNLYLEVRGHSDGSGSRSINRRLAARRAEAVRAYLHRASGLPLTRIAVAVLSTSVPVAKDDTAEGRARNRRVVVVALR